jgi:hypothetical protein
MSEAGILLANPVLPHSEARNRARQRRSEDACGDPDELLQRPP